MLLLQPALSFRMAPAWCGRQCPRRRRRLCLQRRLAPFCFLATACPPSSGKRGPSRSCSSAPLAASPEFPYGSRLVWPAMPETQEAVVPATPPHAFLATACPPSSGKRGPSRSCSSASSGSSGGRPSPPIDADGRQFVVGRMGKGRSRAKIPKKALERERDGSL